MSNKNGLSVTSANASPIRSGTDKRLINSPKAFAGPTIMRTAPEIIAVTFKQTSILFKVSSRYTTPPINKA